MEVWYMDGAGNRFMAVLIQGGRYDLGALAVKLCKLMPADGLLALEQGSNGELHLHYRNRDGSSAEFCGNGARCACRFAWEQGLCGEKMILHTDAGLLEGARLEETRYRIRMGLPRVKKTDPVPGIHYLELGDPGVPHAIGAYEGDLWQDREGLRPKMRALRFHPAFLRGANVSLYTWEGPDAVRLLTYERGVEDFTPSCGSASICTACLLRPNGRLTVRSPGGTLTVTADKNAVSLEGPAEILDILQQ